MPAPIQIKREDVVADVRALASLMGLSITDAIAGAIRKQLAVERVRAVARLRKRRAEAAKTLEKLRRLPVTGPLLADEDLYDAEGLPR